ncbi:MAG: GFA family protein [Pseudomonadota bacterium]
MPCKSARFDGDVTRFASSDHAERGFCPTCGSHLFFHAKGPGVYAIPVGVFEDASDLPFRAQIYVDEKPDQYEFANETRMMTGPEFEAKFR